MQIPVLFVYSDRFCSCSRVRTFEVVKALHQYEKEYIFPSVIYYEDLEEEHFENFPIILFQRLGANGTLITKKMKEWFSLIFAKYRNKCKFIYDLDDFLIERQEAFPKWMLSNCHIGLAPNEVLKSEFEKYSNLVEVIRTHIDEGILNHVETSKRPPLENRKTLISWFSTGLHGISFMSSISDQLQKKIGDFAEIHFYGHIGLISNVKELLPSPLFHVNKIVSLNEMHSIVKNSHFMINPLGLEGLPLDKMIIDSTQMDLFTRSKCEIKFLHAGLFGKPLITTPIDSYKVAIENRKTGFFAESKEDWINLIEKLVFDHQLRESVGNAAQKVVLEKYTLKRVAHDYKNLFVKLI